MMLFVTVELDHLRACFQFPVEYGSLFSAVSEQQDSLIPTGSSSLTTGEVIGSQRSANFICLLSGTDCF